jgi:hypothetical protein
MIDAINFAEHYETPILIGCDANAHSIVWGSTNNNARGTQLLDFINTTNLHIMNRGNEPTFVNRIRKEVINITLASRGLANEIEGWHVSKEPSLSDHRRIFFRLCLGRASDIYRNGTNTEPTTDCESPHNFREIELEVEDLTNAMTVAYERSCPVITKSNKSNPKWWNHELQQLRNVVRRAWKIAYGTQLQNKCDRYRDLLKIYKKKCHRAKRQAWKDFISEIETTTETSRLKKILLKGHIQSEFLERDDGSLSTNMKESLQILLEKNFPGAIYSDNPFTGIYNNRPVYEESRPI